MKEKKINAIMSFIAVALLFFYSCTGQVNDEVVADMGSVVFYNNGDTLPGGNISKEIMEDIEKVKSGQAQIAGCKPTGAFFLYRNSEMVGKIEFSTDATGADNGCQMLLSQNKAWRLTYRVGMFLDETFYDLKNKK